MSTKGKRGVARDAARLRQTLAQVRTPGELRHLVSQIAASEPPENVAQVWRVCWEHSPLAGTGPAPAYS